MGSTPHVHTITTPLGKYIFDVNTDQILRVADDLFEILKDFKSEKLDAANENVKYEFKRLQSDGFFSTHLPEKAQHQIVPLLAYHLERNIEQITLQMTQECNFRCDYCAYSPKDFEFQRSHSAKKMSYETAVQAIDFLADHSADQPKVSIGFYGGEPLLAFDLMKKTVLYAEGIFEGKELSFTTTTNASLLTLSVAGFLHEHNIDVMISLDGSPEIHNRSRKFAATGEGTFDVIEKNLLAVKDVYPEFFKKIHFNIVVDPRFSCDNMHEIFTYNTAFKDSQIQSTLIDDQYEIEHVVQSEVFSIESRQHEFKALLSQMGRYPINETSKVALAELNSRRERIKESFFSLVELPKELSHGGPCIPGQRRLFVDVDGNFFPCERVSEASEAMLIGNLNDGFDFEKARSLLNICELTEDECLHCWGILHCSTCARACDNNGELSKAMKLANCRNVLDQVEESFRDHIFFQEFMTGREV